MVEKPPAHARGVKRCGFDPWVGKMPWILTLTCMIVDVNDRVTGRKAKGLQMGETVCKCQTFFISLLSSRRKLVLYFSPFFVQT